MLDSADAYSGDNVTVDIPQSFAISWWGTVPLQSLCTGFSLSSVLPLPSFNLPPSGEIPVVLVFP